MPLSYEFNLITEDDYLQEEKISELKHEYVDGSVYAIAGTSKNHQRIVMNIIREFGNHLMNGPCEPFASDLKVKAESKFFYPDVMVVCENSDIDCNYTKSPVIIIEVLSACTRKMDKTTKRNAYQKIPTLKEYVLIEQDFMDIEVCRKSEGWRSGHYFLGDQVTFEAIDCTLSVEEIYQRVENDDMKALLSQLDDEMLDNPKS
jgi:Uma2 family endonuclease